MRWCHGRHNQREPTVRTTSSIITAQNKSRPYPQSADDGIIDGIIHDSLSVDLRKSAFLKAWLDIIYNSASPATGRLNSN